MRSGDIEVGHGDGMSLFPSAGGGFLDGGGFSHAAVAVVHEPPVDVGERQLESRHFDAPVGQRRSGGEAADDKWVSR